MRVIHCLFAGSLVLLAGCNSTDNLTQSKEPDTNVQTAIVDTKEINATEEVNATPVPQIDVWQRIRNGLQFKVPNEKLVRQYRKWYLKIQSIYCECLNARSLSCI